MNTRSAYAPGAHSRESAAAAALTIGSGARAADSGAATESVPESAILPGLGRASDLFTRRTGYTPGLGTEVLLRWPEVIRENLGRGYIIHPGSLGEVLRTAGIRSEAGGGRLSTPVAVAGDGTVTRVEISNLDRAGPATLLVWDAGDEMSAAGPILRRAMANVAQHGGELIAVSLARGVSAGKDRARLMPIVFWGPKIRPGLIYSPSTHRAGIVTSTDLASTIADHFGASLPFGRPFSVTPSGEPLNTLVQIEQSALTQQDAMWLLPYVAIAIGIFIAICTMLIIRRNLPLWLPALPALTILALIVSVSLHTVVIAAALGTVAAALWAWRRPRQNPLPIISLLIAAIVLGDLCTGCHWMQLSLLGYSPFEGARYFGLGNEGMGALIGALLCVSIYCLDLERPRLKLILYCCLIGTVFLLGSPLAGAKAGGVVVAGAAFGTLIAVSQSKRPSGRLVLLSVLAALLALGLFAVADALRPSALQSHMGVAIHRILANGWSEAGDIAGRKTRVEARLLVHSAWAIPLWASIICCALLSRRRIAGNPQHYQALPWAGTVAMAASLLVNDAGVVAATLCGTLLWCAIASRQLNGSDAQAAITAI